MSVLLPNLPSHLSHACRFPGFSWHSKLVQLVLAALVGSPPHQDLGYHEYIYIYCSVASVSTADKQKGHLSTRLRTGRVLLTAGFTTSTGGASCMAGSSCMVGDSAHSLLDSTASNLFCKRISNSSSSFIKLIFNAFSSSICFCCSIFSELGKSFGIKP